MRQLFVHIAVFVLTVFGYLQPFHSIPWMSAVNNSIFVGLGLVVAAGSIVASRHTAVRYGWAEVCIVSLVLLHGLMSTYGGATQKSLVPLLLVVGTTYMCVKLSSQRLQLARVLMLGIFVAGLVSALFGMGLWLGAAQQYDGYQVWMAHAEPGSALISNLAQPNHAGTLLVWAIAVAGLYAYQLERNLKPLPFQQQVGQGALLACSILMGCAAALTQSRTALLNLVLMLLVALFFRRHLGSKAIRLVVVGVAVAMLVTALLPSIKQFLFDKGYSSILGGKTLGDTARVVAYTTFFEAVKAHWVIGYGMGGVTTAYMENISVRPALNSYFGQAHNLPLEILVCLGIPLGSSVLALLGFCVMQAGKNVKSVEDGATFFMIAAVLVHAMLEYPLHYAYFLLPTAIFVKLLQPEHRGRSVSIGWYWLGVVWVALAALFFTVTENYLEVEQDLRQAKLQAALSGRPQPAPVGYSNPLRELAALNIALRTNVDANVSAAEMQAYALVVHVYPTRKFLQNYIQILLARHNEPDAAIWSHRLRLLYGDID